MTKSPLFRMRIAIAVLIVSATLATMVTPAIAATPAGDFPPLPKWPIIGPILRFLGLVAPTSPTPTPTPVAPTPDPNLPEYRITTMDDLQQLTELESGKRVRVVISEDDLNRLLSKALTTYAEDKATASVSFDTDLVAVTAYADRELLDSSGIKLPNLGGDSVQLMASFGLDAANCRPVVTIKQVGMGNWHFGLRTALQRIIDDRIQELWPTQVCIEHVFLTPGEAAVEGYRQQ